MTTVVDTSALVCLLLDEETAPDVETALSEAEDCRISSATLVEAMIVAEARKGPAGALKLDEIMREAEIRVVEHSPEAAASSVDGWRRFGKGRHPASLNLGDCYTYGLARHLDAPVVCVGDDFVRTDLETLPAAVAR